MKKNNTRGLPGLGGDKPIEATKKSTLASGLLALEPRILFDGAAIATGADALAEAASAAHDTQTAYADANMELLSALNGEEGGELASEQPSSGIVFIDGGVEDYEAIAADIDPSYEVYILDTNSDGVEQIASVLAGRRDVQSLHIISHGRSGTLDLGSTKLTEASMASRHADEMTV
ncbi:MAG: DUF4347 domain-containing protein, partial [Anderseniella sp.]